VVPLYIQGLALWSVSRCRSRYSTTVLVWLHLCVLCEVFRRYCGPLSLDSIIVLVPESAGSMLLHSKTLGCQRKDPGTKAMSHNKLEVNRAAS
jgi:hypothetical protein